MRAFVAVELPAAVRDEVARRADAVSSDLPAARWVRRESLHLTLHFLGEVTPKAVERLAGPLGEACARTPVLTAGLAGGGCFPPRRPARVAWAGIGPVEPLCALQARVAAAVDRPLGLEPERRPFSPHVTVARCRRPWPRAAVERFERAFAGAVGGPFEVRSAALMESRLGPSGARYRRVAAYPLGGAAADGGAGNGKTGAAEDDR